MNAQKDDDFDVEEKPAQKERMRKKVKNVFTYMESTYNSQGPKSLLYRSIQENRRIKVWTRSHSYVRSICTGYLVAFDQYWNLAMSDVDEVYKIPQSRLKDCEEEKKEQVEESSSNKPVAQKSTTDLCKLFSQLNLYKSGRFNIFERHVNQMLIRGDNVVTIAFAD